MTARRTQHLNRSDSWTGNGYIDLLAPRVEDIDVEEIATALSRQPRFNGLGTTQSFSVAQHVLFVLYLGEREGITERRLLRTLLHHDSPEAFLGDVVYPLKFALPGYQQIESRMWGVIANAFDLYLCPPPVVKRLDLMSLAAEKAAFVSAKAGRWVCDDYPTEPIPKHIIFADAAEIRRLFLDAHERTQD